MRATRHTKPSAQFRAGLARWHEQTDPSPKTEYGHRDIWSAPTPEEAIAFLEQHPHLSLVCIAPEWNKGRDAARETLKHAWDRAEGATQTRHRQVVYFSQKDAMKDFLAAMEDCPVANRVFIQPLLWRRDYNTLGRVRPVVQRALQDHNQRDLFAVS